MKKTLIIGSVVSFSLAMASCTLLHDTTQVGTSVVHTGERVVTTTGHVVGTSVHKGLNLLTGQTATHHDVATYRRHGVIHHNGHMYKIEHGKYVLVR